MGVYDLWKNFHLIEISCSMSVKLHGIKLLRELRF